LWERPLAASAIPYGYIHQPTDGPWRLDDQAAVIPSFSGDGISIALYSARLAANAYLAGNHTGQFQALLNRSIANRVRAAALLSRALVSPLTQPLLAISVRIYPDLLRQVAAWTRIPPTALTFTRQHSQISTQFP
jgi:flavin-dependent dehydrogenase